MSSFFFICLKSMNKISEHLRFTLSTLNFDGGCHPKELHLTKRLDEKYQLLRSSLSKKQSDFYFEEKGSLKHCLTLQQPPKPRVNYLWISMVWSPWVWIALFSYTISNAGVAGTCSFLNPHQKGASSEQEYWHDPIAVYVTAFLFLCQQPTGYLSACPFHHRYSIIHQGKNCSYSFFQSISTFVGLKKDIEVK